MSNEKTPAVTAAANWAVNLADDSARRRIMDGHRSRRVPVWRGGFRAEDHTAADEWLVQEHAAHTIRHTPVLLAEARGWISDAYSTEDGDTPDYLSPRGVIKVLQRGYDGGCAEFIRNSAALTTEAGAES